jgi:FlaA1/EpsC-like NDP-sugar epimerase
MQGCWKWLRSNTSAVCRAALWGLDGMLVVVSLHLALLLRFDGAPPREFLDSARSVLPLWVGTRLLFAFVFQLHRWSFWRPGLNEALQLCAANVFGSLVISGFSLQFRASPLPRSAYVLELLLTTAMMAAVRFGPRVMRHRHIQWKRARSREVSRTLILGAGTTGDLLLRDILGSSAHPYDVIGYLDDDLRKVGTSLNGKRVLATIEELPRCAQAQRVSTVLIAIPGLPQERIRAILRLCSHLNLRYKIVPGSLAHTANRLSAAMLDDLGPDDLLARDPVPFDVAEIRQHLQGRRVLVTGAGGSIGSEIARQIARHAPERLVLLDFNENGLYLLSRSLQARHPRLLIYPVVANIRDEARMLQLGFEHRPQDIFHAAAHKHVPLMEDAPGEALKNNVLGTLYVARMADSVRADRFVLISTDKAVRPTSVMGASKRAAEVLIRAMGERSQTQFTAVRIGNVLGSAGSVVPLFTQQIREGGPVTVTHPDCRRYFMSIGEAVGLVLRAGLGRYGQLCVLEMGEPVRIADFAANVITLAGLIPGRDIPIVYTGLRPGEKLTEELLTEEEEKTEVVRNGIRVARPLPPPPGAWTSIEALQEALALGHLEEAMHQLQQLVPSYRPAPPAPKVAIPALEPRQEVVSAPALVEIR